MGSFPHISPPKPYTPPLLTHTRHMPNPSHSSRSILILSTHLRLGLPSGLLPSCFPTKTLYTPFLTHTRHMPSPSHSSRSILRLSTHLRLGLAIDLLPSCFPTKTLHTPSPHPNAPHAPPISFFSIHPNIIHPSTPRSPQCSPSLLFPHQDPTHPLSSPKRATCPAHLILLYFISHNLLYINPFQFNLFPPLSIEVHHRSIVQISVGFPAKQERVSLFN